MLKEGVYFIIDLAEQLLRKCMVVYLLHGLLDVKERYTGHERWVEAGFVACTAGFYMVTNYLPGMKRLLYGNEEGILNSRDSILPMLISLTLMLVYCLYFYAGKKSNIFYLILTAYALNELTLFTLHSLFVALNNGFTVMLNHLLMEENDFVIRHFYLIWGCFQAVWNMSFQAVFLLILMKATLNLRKNLSYGGRKPNNIQSLFLAVPSVMGLCFCVFLRSIMYAFNGEQLKFLMDEYPETKVLIPVVSGLCLLSILLSATILHKLVESSEKEMVVEVYKNRINDMEEHMKDVEHLYDGIRGMRHDMKNYVADLEILLKKESGQSEEYGQEVRRYLKDLYSAMEELDVRCSTGNPVTDVVVSRKMRSAARAGIPFESSFIFPEKLGISAFDVSILLNNALDNALEASEKEENPYIHLDSYVKGNMFFIEVKNVFTGSVIPAHGGKDLKTSKSNDLIHGLGIKNMRSCAEKYYGALKWEDGNGKFLLTIMLQGKENENEHQ